MKKFFKWEQIIDMLKTHLGMASLSTVLGVVMIPFASAGFFKTLFTIIIMAIYAIMIYNKGADIARRDKLYYKDEKQVVFKGAFLPIGIYAVWLFLYILFSVSWEYNIIIYNSGFINNMLFVVWNHPFSGFINIVNGSFDIFGVILFFLVPLAASTGGYAAGVKGYDISVRVAKMVYEEQDNRESEK